MLRDIADDEKPREKALNQGFGALTDSELLAILLRVGIKGKSVINVAREILDKYGNDLSRLAAASPRELTQLVPGIGPTKAITVKAALELGQRCRASAAKSKPQLNSSEKIYEYIRYDLEQLDHEEFWVLMLNKRLGAISFERISTGGLDMTAVDIRMIIKHALDARAIAMVVAHNHPSGNLLPSMQDDNLTKRIKEAAALLDIRLLDHIIVAASGYYSYNDRGRL
ncbi:MAG: DNA repair protein RadC [Bacteroides sp.]|nr:DNA repair protein RadC [Bacteroides sp.]MCM1379162.1 DNA repair protein RadC [Bacteroides sp.]MCM1445189.1 DNA repair protein RadC [Prevotella sp.]